MFSRIPTQRLLVCKPFVHRCLLEFERPEFGTIEPQMFGVPLSGDLREGFSWGRVGVSESWMLDSGLLWDGHPVA